MTDSIDFGENAGSAELPIERPCLAALLDSLQDYFELMHDCDLSRFDRVFAPSVQLHGYRDGQMLCWSAPNCRDILAARQSPKSLGAPRADEILLIDFASTTQAFTKVSLRISAMVFVDYLTKHNIEGRRLITSKGFHLERSA